MEKKNPCGWPLTWGIHSLKERVNRKIKRMNERNTGNTILLDLDLDSTRVPRSPSRCMHWPHFHAILICFELPPLLPPRWVLSLPSLTSLCWRCSWLLSSSSWHVDDLDPSWTLEPPCASVGDQFVFTCPSQRSFLSLSIILSSMLYCPVILTLISSFVTLSFQEAVDLGGWLLTEMVYPLAQGHTSKY